MPEQKSKEQIFLEKELSRGKILKQTLLDKAPIIYIPSIALGTGLGCIIGACSNIDIGFAVGAGTSLLIAGTLFLCVAIQVEDDLD